MFNTHDIKRNEFMLHGPLAHNGYDWWCQNFTAVNEETEVFCKKKDMLLVNYEAPDGKKLHNRLWNGGNGYGAVKLFDRTDNGFELVDEIKATHIGCEYGEYDG